MALALFLLQTILISLSGAMAPGPITAVTLGQGSRRPFAGTWIALGHGLVEMPLIIGLLLGLGELVELPYVKVVIGLAGGAFLLWMGFDMLRSIPGASSTVAAHVGPRNPVWAGVILSASNPYFLLWWVAVGMALIIQAKTFGPMGFTLFAVVHWACDLVWLTILSLAAHRGGAFLGKKFQQGVFAVCGVALLAFGVRFVVGVF